MTRLSRRWFLVLGVAGCLRVQGEKPKLEKALEAGLATAGLKGRVHCSRSIELEVGATTRCELEVETMRYDFGATITSVNPNDSVTPFKFEIEFARGQPFVRNVIERNLEKPLVDSVGAPIELSCGGEPLVFFQNNRLQCSLRSGKIRASTTLVIDDTGTVKVTLVDPPLVSRTKLEALLREGTKAEFGSDMVIDCGPEAIIARPADGAVRCQASKGAEKAPLDVVVAHDTENATWKLLAPSSWKVAAR